MAQTSKYTEQETRDFKERAAEQAEHMAEKATDQFRSMGDHASGTAGRAAERGREAGQRMQEVAGNLKGAVDKSVRDQPLTTLAVATAAGFLLGALWKR